jgi:hypothetical protein
MNEKKIEATMPGMRAIIREIACEQPTGTVPVDSSSELMIAT